MNAVQDRASLHEKAVQAVARGEVKQSRRRWRQGSTKPSTKVTGHSTDPLLMAWINEHVTDRRCVEFVAPDEVIVHNSPDWRRSR
jgi:hypothetical protein